LSKCGNNSTPTASLPYGPDKAFALDATVGAARFCHVPMFVEFCVGFAAGELTEYFNQHPVVMHTRPKPDIDRGGGVAFQSIVRAVADK
jgi:hypothetical protein